MVAGTPGTEELSWEIVVTRRSQPTSPTSSSACCLLLTRFMPQTILLGRYHCSKFMEEMWGSRGSMAHPILPRSKELPPACGTPPSPRSFPPPRALACRRWPVMLWKDCALPEVPCGSLLALFQVARDSAEINSKSARKEQIIYLGPESSLLTLSTQDLFPDILVFD